MSFSEEQLLDLARKQAEEAEVYALAYEETPVSFEANRLKGISTRQSTGVALRIIKDGRIGFTAGTGPDRAEDLLQTALETAPFGATARFHMPGAATYPLAQVFSPEVEQLSLEAMAHAGQQAIDTVVAHTPNILCDATVIKRTTSLRILNSAGLSAAITRSTFSARLDGTLVRGTDMLFVGDRKASCQPDLDLSDLAQETIRKLELARDTVPAPRGQVPIVFTPNGFVQAFVSSLSLGLSGKTVLQGTSPLIDKIGQACFDPAFTLVDDPTIPWCPAGQSFDDEGVPSQRRPLIEAGVLRGFVYDLQTAAMAGVQSTGNAERALTGQPSPGINVMTVAPGQTSWEDLIGGIQEGLIIDQMIGSSQGNTLGGDFGGNVLLGYKIERGQIVGRVKDVMAAGNLYTILARDIAFSNEAKWVGGSLLVPALLCQQGVTVSSKA